MKLLFTLLFLECTLLVFPQESKVYFDSALSKYLLTYNNQVDKAIVNHDFERAEFLFDSLVKFHLKGTFVPNLKLNKISGGFIETDSLKNPFLLITKTIWSTQKEEIEAINNMATQYQNQIDIIVLYWDSFKNVKRLAKQYNKAVILTYIDETKNNNGPIVKTYKHSFGAPACFFVSQYKQLVFLNKKFELYKERLNNIVMPSNDTYGKITLLLFELENSSKGIITTLDNDDDTDY